MMATRVTLTVGFLALAFGAVAADPEGLKPHPRLIADEARFARMRAEIARSPLGQEAVRQVLAAADFSLAEGRPIDYVLLGKRMSSGTPLQQAVLPLAFAWRWTGERKYAAAAISHALTACRDWPDFHPSHFLDTAIAGFAVALVYDWCFAALTPDERALLAREIDARALVPALDAAAPWHVQFSRTSNWNQVCNGGMLACAAAVREDFPEHAEAVRRQAVAGLPHALGVYAPEGCWPEGPGYWGFAMSYTAIAFDALEAGWGTTSGLDRLPGLDRAVEYLDAVTGPEGLTFNHGDNGAVRSSQFGVWYLADRYGRPEALVGFERDLLGAAVRENRPVTMSSVLILPYFREPDRGMRPLPLCRALTNSLMGIVSQRTSWRPGAWFVALRAGSAQAGHAHLDLGSFVFDALGTRWALDLGGETYVKVEQAHVDLWSQGNDAERWNLFRYASEGHNTVTVNGHSLKADASAPIVAFASGFPSVATIDLTPVLPETRSARRTSTLYERGGWDLTDALTGVQPGKKIAWRMNTDAQIRLDGRVATLTKTVKGKPVSLSVTLDGVEAVWEVRDVSKPPHPCDSDNPGVRQLFFRATVPTSGALESVVRFR